MWHVNVVCFQHNNGIKTERFFLLGDLESLDKALDKKYGIMEFKKNPKFLDWVHNATWHSPVVYEEAFIKTTLGYGMTFVVYVYPTVTFEEETFEKVSGNTPLR